MALAVKGFRELNRAFSFAERDVRLGFRKKLREAAEPVREDAERLATQRIRNIGGPWSRMRVGVTQRVVYLAPRERGVTARAAQRRRRPNLAVLLMDRSMQPALDDNNTQVERSVEELLGEMERDWGRGG